MFIWNVLFEIIIFFRTGYLPNEKGKKGWKEEKVIFNNVFDDLEV